jgi:hypothetical protein
LTDKLSPFYSEVPSPLAKPGRVLCSWLQSPVAKIIQTQIDGKHILRPLLFSTGKGKVRG